MSKKKQETIEEALKRLGIGIASPDDPIYQHGPSISFVPPGRQSTPSTKPSESPRSRPPETPEEREARYSEPVVKGLPRRLRLGLEWHRARIKAAVLDPRPSFTALRSYLRRAWEDGHDWRALYRQEALHRPLSYPPLPPIDWLDPDNPTQWGKEPRPAPPNTASW